MNTELALRQIEDIDLEQRIVNLLNERQRSVLRMVRVEVDNGRVTLQGQVSSYYERQICLSCCRKLAEINEVVDLIEVAPQK